MNEIPRDVLRTLFRALIGSHNANTIDEIEDALAFLEQHNHHEEMGQ